MTTIVCASDLHENLIDIPQCDLLLIAGDVSFAVKGDLPAKQAFLVGRFKQWLKQVRAEEIVLVAGNHDQSIEAWGLPPGLRCRYLEDEGVELFGLKLWGTPWQPWFSDWAFNAPLRNGELFLASKFASIPADTDVVVCHGPPRGYGDHNGQPGEDAHVGSNAMTDVLQRLQPQLVVCGHIHSGYGRYTLGNSEIINASLVDNDYIGSVACAVVEHSEAAVAVDALDRRAGEVPIRLVEQPPGRWQVLGRVDGSCTNVAR